MLEYVTVPTLAFAFVAALNTVPRIIWAIRCKADSPNYKHPAPPHWFVRFLDHKG